MAILLNLRSRFYEFDDLTKYYRVIFSKLGKNLTIKTNVCFFKQMNKLTVRKPVLAHRGIKLYSPELTKLTFFIPTVAIGIHTRFTNSGFSERNFALAAPAIPLGLL